MAQAAAAPTPDWDAECLTVLQPLPLPAPPAATQARLQTAALSLCTVVAAVQAVEGQVESHSQRLLYLEGRTGTAEKKLASCEKAVAELGSQLEGKWAVLGTLLQECGLLQRRLEHLETLLRGGRSWVLRLPPGITGDIPQVPAAFDDVPIYFSTPEWEKLEEWQKELYKNIMKGNCASPIPMDYAMNQPDVLSQMQPEEHRREDQAGPEESAIPAVPSEEPVLSTSDILSWIKQEEEPQVETPQESKESDLYKNTYAGEEPVVKAEGLAAASLSPDAGPFSAPPAATLKDAFADVAFRSPQSAPVTPSGPAAADLPEASGERVTFTQLASCLLPRVGEPLPCPRCGQSLSQDALPTHQCSHPGEHPPPCARSPQLFPPPAQPARGSAPPDPAVAVRPACPHCARTFTHPAGLAGHLRVHERPERPFPCPDCPKRFAYQARLRGHQRRAHGRGCGLRVSLQLPAPGPAQGPPFCCAQCGAAFHGRSALARHRAVHTGERPHRCADCGKGFARREHLLSHRRLHTGERPFPCAECGRSFVHKHHLLKHQRVHTGERPFPCAECGRRFRCKQKLKDHLRVHSRARAGPPDPGPGTQRPESGRWRGEGAGGGLRSAAEQGAPGPPAGQAPGT